jgi:hypothetical protein
MHTSGCTGNHNRFALVGYHWGFVTIFGRCLMCQYLPLHAPKCPFLQNESKAGERGKIGIGGE